MGVRPSLAAGSHPPRYRRIPLGMVLSSGAGVDVVSVRFALHPPDLIHPEALAIHGQACTRHSLPTRTAATAPAPDAARAAPVEPGRPAAGLAVAAGGGPRGRDRGGDRCRRLADRSGRPLDSGADHLDRGCTTRP